MVFSNSRRCTPLLLLHTLFLSLLVLPAFSLRIIIAPKTSVNARTTLYWVPEPADQLGQDPTLPPSTSETSLFDLRFVNADTQADDGLAMANVDVRLAAVSGGIKKEEVVFTKPGKFFLRAVSGPTFRTIGTSNVFTVTPASTIKLGPTPTSPGSPDMTSPTTTTPATASQPKNQTPIIVGALLGALIFLTFLGLLLFFLIKRRRIQREEEEAISRLSFHPDQMVISKRVSVRHDGGGNGLNKRQSIVARFWGSFAGSSSGGHATTSNSNSNSNAAAPLPPPPVQDLEAGLVLVPATKPDEERRPSDTTSLSTYSSHSGETVTGTDSEDPHVQIRDAIRVPASVLVPPPPAAVVNKKTPATTTVTTVTNIRKMSAPLVTFNPDPPRDRESVNSVQDLVSPRVLDRSSTVAGSATVWRNPFLSSEESAKQSGMKEVPRGMPVSVSVMVPPPSVVLRAPAPVPAPTSNSGSGGLRALPVVPVPAPVSPLVPRKSTVRRKRSRTVGRVVADSESTPGNGEESPRLPPVRFSQVGLGLVFGSSSPPKNNNSNLGPTAVRQETKKEEAPPAVPPKTPIRNDEEGEVPVPKIGPPPPPKRVRNNSNTPAARPLPTPTFPTPAFPTPTPAPAPVYPASATHAPARPTTPGLRPLPTPTMLMSIPQREREREELGRLMQQPVRTPSPPTPGVVVNTFRALPAVPGSAPAFGGERRG